MTYCGNDMLETYRSTISRVISEHGETANVESVLALLAKNEVPVEICDASGFGWLEVDTQEDLNRAEEILRNNPDYLI